MNSKKPSAQTAIEILIHLQNLAGQAAMAYWVLPNVILTLAGARAICDGVFYHPKGSKKMLKEWVVELGGHIRILKDHTDVYYGLAKIDRSAWGDPIAVYDLLLTQGFEYSLSQTDLIGAEKITLTESKLSPTELKARMLEMVKRNQEKLKTIPDFFDDINSGILLGYPDKAIMGAIGEWDNVDPFREPLVEADIRGAKYYECPVPIYDYPRHLINDKDIQAHEELWSNILKEFYDSDFHRKLATNTKFIEKAKQIGTIR